MNGLPAEVGAPKAEQRRGSDGSRELELTFNAMFDKRFRDQGGRMLEAKYGLHPMPRRRRALTTGRTRT
jgi:hypothetical protein